MKTIAPLLVAAALLGGCATTGPANPRDPLEPFNRKAMEFNDNVDSILLKPAATAYQKAVPPMVRTGVSNFFGNLADAWSFVNSVLQLRPVEAQESFARFHINTFIGIGGLFDVASDFNIERHREDFGQTLGRWGMPAGPYIVLPLFGPSTLRDTLALPVDRQFDPVSYVTHAAPRNFFYVLRTIDARSNLLRVGNVIDGAALDRYSFTREAYLQKRRADIFDYKESDTDGAEPKSDGTPAPASKDTPESQQPRQPAAVPAR